MPDIVEPGAKTPPLSVYVFAAVSGTATLTGYFVDDSGFQVTPLITMAITTAKTLSDLYDTAASLSLGTILANSWGGLEGFRGALAGSALYEGQGGNPDGTIKAGMTPAAGYPQRAISSNVALGRVG